MTRTLDTSKLLGFRLAGGALGAKTGAKDGAKIGTKVGVKPVGAPAR